jgi:hypothetical protein
MYSTVTVSWNALQKDEKEKGKRMTTQEDGKIVTQKLV